MTGFLTPSERAIVAAACARLLPPGAVTSGPGAPITASPGADAAAVVEYIDGVLDAFGVDPPRIFAGGPFSGRAGGPASTFQFLRLSRLEELAWRIRIEGSRGLPEREFNGPVVGWQEQYRSGVASLGADFGDVDGAEQDRRLEAQPQFKQLLFTHACEGMYAGPEYGGNRDLAGWAAIGFAGDVLPRGYTPEEVAQP